jgi:hypothetical protein
MSDTSTFGGSFGPTSVGGAPLSGPGGGADVPPNPSAPPHAQGIFGSGLSVGGLGQPRYTAPDPQASALDQTADTLQQQIKIKNNAATNPIANFFDPEGAAKARADVPALTEQLQKIRAQKADMAANRRQAETLGLHPGDVPDEASQADRVEAATGRALKGDLTVFKGLQVVDPQRAAAIQDQVHETVAGHLTKAKLAFDSLAAMPNQRQYDGKLAQLRKEGTLTDLEALGLKVGSYDQFNAVKGKEGQALREARVGVDSIRAKIAERSNGTPMEEKEQKTYEGRLTTESGQKINNGTWARINGSRVFQVNGMGDIRDLGKKYNLASDDQRKAIEEAREKAIPKEEIEKARGFNRTYQLATTDAKGNKLPDGAVNTNPNVQQGMAEGLASMLRGGNGGANVGLLKIETNKRGFLQGLVDKISTEKGAALNELKGADVNPYLSKLTQGQIRDVMDAIKQYNDISISNRTTQLARRAGELGLDASALGLGKGEVKGVEDAIEEGRQSTINRFTQRARATGGGDGGIFLDNPPPVSVNDPPHPPGSVPPVPQPVQPQSPIANAPAGASGNPPVGSPPGGDPAPAGGPITVAGHSVTPNVPPGVSPNYVASMQRIESGNERNPWTSTTRGSSASGAFQMIDRTWNANKPAGAPARAKDATPEQQTQANDKFMATNAAALQRAGVPVNDTTMYITHNLGEAGGPKLLRASPNADARSVVGEDAAKNNPLFFKGRPTVATVLARYDDEMNKGGATGGNIADVARHRAHAAQQAPQGGGFWSRLSQKLQAGDPSMTNPEQTFSPEGKAAMTENAAAVAPAAASTVGQVFGGPVGGGIGGAAGSVAQDLLRGQPINKAKAAEEGALGTVLGVGGLPRGLNMAARALGAGGVEGGAAALKGGDAGDIADKGVTGAASAFGGELFGRSLGMIGHKVFSMFTPDAQKAVQGAAKSYHEATQTLETETPKLPGVGGAAGTVNPKFEAAEAAKDKAETVLKDAGLKPEEAAYAHKVSSEGVPKREAEASRPGAIAEADIGKGYQQLEKEVGDKGVGAPKGRDVPLPDGPMTAVVNKQVPARFSELAERVESEIRKPAASWQEKWTQLKDARSDLLEAERTAKASTGDRKKETSDAYRTLADTVRKQQEKAAKYVFGEEDGKAFMGRLKVLDTRYRNLMEATNGGDLAEAARLTGEKGREADKKFRAFAHDDKVALAAWGAMRKKGGNVEQDVLDQIRIEKVPYIGTAVGAGRYMLGLRKWAQDRAAGSPATFADFMRQTLGPDTGNRTARDIGGAAGSRAATM